MKSSSLTKLLSAQGIDSPRAYRDALIHDWDPGTKVIANLKIFMLKRVNTDDLFACIQDGEFRLNKNLYSVIWMNSPSFIRGQDSCLVSFRYCSILERGYALVRTDSGGNVAFLNLTESTQMEN